jgi:hypothetical protein
MHAWMPQRRPWLFAHKARSYPRIEIIVTTAYRITVVLCILIWIVLVGGFIAGWYLYGSEIPADRLLQVIYLAALAVSAFTTYLVMSLLVMRWIASFAISLFATMLIERKLFDQFDADMNTILGEAA